jgi:hypothetical protein
MSPPTLAAAFPPPRSVDEPAGARWLPRGSWNTLFMITVGRPPKTAPIDVQRQHSWKVFNAIRGSANTLTQTVPLLPLLPLPLFNSTSSPGVLRLILHFPLPLLPPHRPRPADLRHNRRRKQARCRTAQDNVPDARGSRKGGHAHTAGPRAGNCVRDTKRPGDGTAMAAAFVSTIFDCLGVVVRLRL